MSLRPLMPAVAIALLLGLGACTPYSRGGGGGGGGGGDDDDASDDLEIAGSAEYPFLTMAEGVGGDLIFPTYLAHLLGGTVTADWWGGDFACVSLENESSASGSIEVTAELVGYSSAVSELRTISANASLDLCLNPVPDLDALYGLSSEANSQVLVRVTDASSGALLWQESDSVRISTQGDIFFMMDGVPARSSTATLVRPDTVIDVLDDMVELSWFNGSIGVGGYRAHPPSSVPWWPWATVSVSAGGYYYKWLYMEAGETVEFTASSDGADSWLYVVDSADFQNLQSGSPFLVWWQEEIDTSQSGSFTAPSSGSYYLVAYNYSSIFSENVTWRSKMTRADNVLDYLYIAFTYLQNLGINYINVPGNFFDGSQQCLLPDEVISNGGGNCIDGTLLFASLLEQIGVRPIITYVPGHAFISVDSGPTGYNTVWSLETTMMGSSSSFWDALGSGLQQHAEAPFDGALFLDLYVDEARADGILPMP